MIGFIGSPVTTRAASSGLQYAAWVPYWEKTAAATETTAYLDKLNEISPFSYTVDSTGHLVDTAQITQAPWPDLLTAAQAKKIKILPSVLWTNSADIDRVLASTTGRDIQTEDIMGEVIARGFDGIDIDYENKYASTSPAFDLFLQELSSKLHAKGKILSCTIEARTPPASRYLVVPEKLEYANNYQVINQVCDQVRLMAYDQGTVDIKLNMIRRLGGLYYPIADTAWVRKVLDLAIQDIDPKKIMLGVANYGYELEVTDKIAYYDYRKVRSLSYKDLLTLALEVKHLPARDNAGELALTYVGSDGKMYFATFSDATAMAAKIDIAKQYGLRGVAIFKVDGESDNYWPYLQ